MPLQGQLKGQISQQEPRPAAAKMDPMSVPKPAQAVDTQGTIPHQKLSAVLNQVACTVASQMTNV